MQVNGGRQARRPKILRQHDRDENASRSDEAYGMFAVNLSLNLRNRQFPSDAGVFLVATVYSDLEAALAVVADKGTLDRSVPAAFRLRYGRMPDQFRCNFQPPTPAVFRAMKSTGTPVSSEGVRVVPLGRELFRLLDKVGHARLAYTSLGE